MGKKLFITGTGTDVGKTYASALIVKKLQDMGKKGAYFKAAMSGNERDEKGKLIPGDALFVKEISRISQPLEEMCPYIYEHPYSPHLAAKVEGNPVNMDMVKSAFEKAEGKYDYITMEGSGGILCPLRWDDQQVMLENVIREAQAPCLIVADAGLGTINSTVLTAWYMKAKKIPVKGILLNRFHEGNIMEEDNRHMCEAMTGLKVIACIRPGDRELAIDESLLLSLYE